MRWISSPFVDDWPRSLVALVAIVGFTTLVYFSRAGWMLTLIALLVLFFSLSRYFFTSVYELTDHGVKHQLLWFRRSWTWGEFKNYYVHPVGIHLSPFAKPCAMDPFRGVFLRFNKNRNQVTSYIQEQLGNE